MNENRLIIEIPYGGFGDHLFHSHIPRIAKETGKYKEVYFSSKSLIRKQDHLDLVWKLNPYIDGFVDESGQTCDLKSIVIEAKKRSDVNLLDLVMLAYGLEDGKRWHDPELYYKPQLIPEYQVKIFDPNHFTYIGDFNESDLYVYLKKHKITFDAVMKLLGNKALYRPDISHMIIDAPSVYEFCDVLYSAKEIYCFTSGTATLSAALGKKATVFYGAKLDRGFHHSKLHNYVFIDKTLSHKLVDALKRLVKIIIGKK